MEVYFKKKWGFVHYKITAKNRKTLFFEKDVHRTSNNSDLLELIDFINIDINIKPCRSKKIAQWKFDNLCNFHYNKILEYLQFKDTNEIVDFIQELL